MHFAGVRSAFPRDQPAVGTLTRHANGGDLRAFGEIVDAVKHRMLQRDFGRLTIRKHAFDFAVEVVPFVASPEVVDHQEAAMQQVASQRGHFLFTEYQLTRFNDVDERVVEQFRIGQSQDAPVRIHVQRCQLLQSPGEVEFRVRVVDVPFVPATPGAVLDANKGKHVVLKLRVDLPVGNAPSIGPHRRFVASPELLLCDGHHGRHQQEACDQNSDSRAIHENSRMGESIRVRPLSHIAVRFASPDRRSTDRRSVDSGGCGLRAIHCNPRHHCPDNRFIRRKSVEAAVPGRRSAGFRASAGFGWHVAVWTFGLIISRCPAILC